MPSSGNGNGAKWMFAHQRVSAGPLLSLYPSLPLSWPLSHPISVWVRWLNSTSHLHTLKCHILHVVCASRRKPKSSNSIRSRSQRQLALGILPGSQRAIQIQRFKGTTPLSPHINYISNWRQPKAAM